jgi:superfamily I DNA/RNA helicase
VDIRTLHSLGLQFIKAVWRNVKIDANVEWDRIDSVSDLRNYPEERAMVQKLVSYAKNICVNPDRIELQNICDDKDLDFNMIDGIQIALDALNLAKTQDKLGRISFDDMVWLPVAMSWVKPLYNLVIVDEAQDMSSPQLVMCRRVSKSRVIVVGDDRQTIYGFRGCQADGLAMMTRELNATSLKLTKTFRCGKKIVKLANVLVPDYQSFDGAHDGEVTELASNAMLDKIAIGDCVLSRLNAPLMTCALSILRKGVPARIEGRDIASQLLKMIKDLRAKSVPDYMAKVESWYNKQVARHTKAKNAQAKIDTARDIVDTLQAVAQDMPSVQAIEQRINDLFKMQDKQPKPAVVLSTVHKAKGLEWDRVFMLNSTFRTGSIEEENIKYVAITRAKNHLFIVN